MLYSIAYHAFSIPLAFGVTDATVWAQIGYWSLVVLALAGFAKAARFDE